ncbi:hypothetical protein XELAEV_18002928mg, partial [Xenopus laevis]
TAFVRAFREDRRTFLHKVRPLEKTSKSALPMFITTYSKQYHEIRRKVQKHLPLLNGDDKLQRVIENGCRFVTRRAKTLGNILSPSDVCNRNSSPRTWLSTVGTYNCGDTRCITRSSEVVSSSTTIRHKVKSYINCNTSYIIYLLTCKKCNAQYVGCTSRSLKSRIREHINSIVSRSSTTTISRHFLECSNGDIDFLKIQGIEKMYQSSKGGDK